MEWNRLQDNRVAVITELVSRAPNGYVGRTAVMKFCYLLQTVRQVPLGYRFTLYSYGPFDSGVLSDLGAAETLQGVVSSVVQYAGGYGYRITKGSRADAIVAAGAALLREYDSSVEWVMAEFGSHSSSDLELESTIIFADREAARKTERLSVPELAQRVKEVKPRFDQEYIVMKATELYSKELLVAAKLDQDYGVACSPLN
jgi:hypothetical protein